MRLDYKRIAHTVEAIRDFGDRDAQDTFTPADLPLWPKAEAEVVASIVRSTSYCGLTEEPEQCRRVVSMIRESLHNDLDGWDDDERTIIEHFLIDIVLACSLEEGWEGPINPVYGKGERT